MKRVFQKRYPYQPKHPYNYAEWQAKEKKYKKWQIATNFLVLVPLFGLPFIYGFLLYYINRLLLILQTDTGETSFPPTIAIFIIAGVVLTLATIGYAVEGMLRLLLGSNYEEYEDYYNTKEEYDNQKVARVITKIFFVPAFVVTIFSLITRLVAHDEGFSVKQFFHLTSQKYVYKDITAIKFTPGYINAKSGIFVNSPSYKVLFSDGRDFGTGSYFSDADAAKFISLIATKAHKKVDTMAVKAL